MTVLELKNTIEGGFPAYEQLYAHTPKGKERLSAAADRFVSVFGEGGELSLFSVSGRSETIGNHTDHNRGCVIAAAIDKDVIAVAAPNDSGKVRLLSEGYDMIEVDLSLIDDPAAFENYSSAALIAGVMAGFLKNGHRIGGYDAYLTSNVLKGSGLSSSAAFEVMIGNINNHFYNDGEVSAVELAQIAQFAENEFFGKPCGLMDQMACAVGGFVFIDFEDPAAPVIEPISPAALSEAGYMLCTVNTGGNHADLNEDYASVPAEMKAVASLLGKEVLRGTAEGELLAKAAEIRATLGDRALLRAIHFIRENERVAEAKKALKAGNIPAFFDCICASGHSSFEYLQNVYTVKAVEEQGLSLALALTDGFMQAHEGAFRVHGGGFAGTILAFVKEQDFPSYQQLLDSVFGEGSTVGLWVRPLGATRLL